VFGPDLLGGNGRLRRSIEPGVAVEVDAGVLHVTNRGEGGDRNAYTGRLGVLLHSQDGHAAIGAGVGGGVSPTAGGWGSVDIHGVVSGANRYVRPLLGGSLGYSAPFGSQTFEVSANDSSPVTLGLPRNSIGEIHVGLELGPPDAMLVLGAALMHFWLLEDSRVNLGSAPAPTGEGFAAVGAGLRFAIP